MRKFLVHIGELPSTQGNCTVFLEEEERSGCEGLSSLVAVSEPAEDTEEARTDYQYDVPEDFEVASLGYQAGYVCMGN